MRKKLYQPVGLVQFVILENLSALFLSNKKKKIELVINFLKNNVMSSLILLC